MCYSTFLSFLFTSFPIGRISSYPFHGQGFLNAFSSADNQKIRTLRDSPVLNVSRSCRRTAWPKWPPRTCAQWIREKSHSPRFTLLCFRRDLRLSLNKWNISVWHNVEIQFLFMIRGLWVWTTAFPSGILRPSKSQPFLSFVKTLLFELKLRFLDQLSAHSVIFDSADHQQVNKNERVSSIQTLVG
jgi:hypothetical protein